MGRRTDWRAMVGVEGLAGDALLGAESPFVRLVVITMPISPSAGNFETSDDRTHQAV